MISGQNLTRIVGALLLVLVLAACNRAQAPAESTAPAQPTTTAAPVEATTEAPAEPTAEPATATIEPIEATPTVEAPAATEPPAEEPAPIGGTLVCDPLNDFTLVIPEGWRALTPPPGPGMGTTTLMNYTEEDVAALGPKAQEGVFPPGAIKIDVSTLPIAAGTFDAFVEERMAGALQGPAGERTTVPAAEPFELGGYLGVSFTLTEAAASPEVAAPPPVHVIIVALGSERVLVVSLIPADSPAHDEALAILRTLTLADYG